MLSSLYLSTSTAQILRTLLMELPKIQDLQYNIVQASKMKFMAPHKIAKYSLAEVVVAVDTGHQSGRFVQIMSWLSSNLGRCPLWN